MPTTRSATRASATLAPASNLTPAADVPPAPVNGRLTQTKRKVSDPSAGLNLPKRRNGKAKATSSSEPQPLPEVPPDEFEPVLLPAELTFSFEDAKKHLIDADRRFEDIFNKLPCKPYERLERVEPFRTLTSSILGQQISWIAARSVRHRFIRLYFPELPEKPDVQYWATEKDDKFPNPQQVAKTELSVLRTAGLSGRKAEYVQDLAARFADGRLSSQKLFDANDEELYEMLTAVRGIGRWTVDMFAIFSLRRPDILPAGDLGVQRGVLRWFLSLHNRDYRIDISPKKLPGSSDKAKSKDQDTENTQDADTLPVFGPADSTEAPSTPPPRAATLPSTDVAIATPLKRKTTMPAPPAPTPSALGQPLLPPVFTPSINATLEGKNNKEEEGYLPLPLPTGLTIAEMKTRLGGKKKIKGAILTPAEIEHFTEPWKPYRSLGVYYMWTLAEEAKEK